MPGIRTTCSPTAAKVNSKKPRIARKTPSETPTYNDLRHGFVYERVPHITLKSIANNAEIDVIYERLQPEVENALSDLNHALRDHSTPFTVEDGGRQGKTIDFGAPTGEHGRSSVG